MQRMTKAAFGALAFFAGSFIAVAQEKPAEPQKAEAKTSRSDAVKAIIAEFTKAQTTAYEELQKLKTDEERSAYYEKSFPKQEDYAKRLLAIVDSDVKDDASGEALSWIVRNADGDVQTKAAAILREHHVKSPFIGDVCLSLIYDANAENIALVRRVIAENPDKGAVGRARYALAKLLGRTVSFKNHVTSPERKPDEIAMLKKHYGGDEWFKWITEFDSAKADAESITLIEKVVAECKDVTYRETTLSAAAEKDLFELKNLAIGRPAPEVAGADAEGIAFKLSDYRGKVVVLDFWGYW